MEYDFLVDTYDIERLKTLNVWSMFKDEDLAFRVGALSNRDRNPLEHMVHQCLSENKWFTSMFGIDATMSPLPEEETRISFIKHYADVSGRYLSELKKKPKDWWEKEVAFFDIQKSRAWILVRRVGHTAHHRGEQSTILRILRREVHSIYGPSVDTGGLPANNAETIYAYPNVASLVEGEILGGRKTKLPGAGDKPSTERPDI